MSSVCSASWIAATEPAKRRALAHPAAVARRRVRARGRASWRRSAHGMTISDASGAARMPNATAVSPVAMPTATATGKQNRDSDSNSTSPP